MCWPLNFVCLLLPLKSTRAPYLYSFYQNNFLLNEGEHHFSAGRCRSLGMVDRATAFSMDSSAEAEISDLSFCDKLQAPFRLDWSPWGTLGRFISVGDVDPVQIGSVCVFHQQPTGCFSLKHTLCETKLKMGREKSKLWLYLLDWVTDDRNPGTDESARDAGLFFEEQYNLFFFSCS